ncbi:MAG: ATP-binding protein, partial [Nitrospirota bacterium]|nr:ATP-binding protein [Nitrospirota bacterium]
GSQVEAVGDGKMENIAVYKGRDEIGKLSEFTYRTLNELHKSNEALSRRLELQHATSEILKAAQKAEDIDIFLKEVLDIILSLKWLNVPNKGGIYLVDEANLDRFFLRAEKNYTESQKKTCSGGFKVGECICGMAAKKGEIIYKALVDEDHVRKYEGMQPHGHYCVPVKHEGKVLGVINLYLEEGYARNELDIEFLQNISMIVSDTLVLKKLSEREHLITMAIEESGESVIIADREGIIEYVNPAFERITGFSRDDVMRESLLTNIKCGLGEDVCGIVKSGSLWSGIFKGKRMDGRDYYEYLSIIPVKDEKGEVTKYVYIGRDITRERSLEEQVRQSQKMEVIGKFAGGIAHDFNNILTAIMGYGEMLMDEMKEEDPLRSYVEAIRSSTGRATNLTKSLLAFSRKQTITLRIVDLNEVIRGVEKLLLRLIGEDVQLRTVLSERSLAVMADPGQLDQVLMNLATNARDAMPEGGTLTIETGVVDIDEEYVQEHIFSKPGTHAVLSVSDNGIGMDEETRLKIFEPFFTTKGVGKGTGLGLSIVYGIIKQHDGNINVYSEQGLGTTFKIFLPLIKAGVEEIKSVETVMPMRGTETVLLAEDDPDVRKLISKVLVKHGYKVMEAVDGEDAVRVFAENRDKIDLLLLDIIMPKMKGTEAYEELTKISPKIKVLFMSGYTEEVIYRKGVLEKGLSFISKPVSPHEILKKIREVLDG